MLDWLITKNSKIIAAVWAKRLSTKFIVCLLLSMWIALRSALLELFTGKIFSLSFTTTLKSFADFVTSYRAITEILKKGKA
jgi:hypothetical protein